MQQTLILKKTKVIVLAWFVFFLSLASLAPLLGNQFLTGPIVNAALFLATIILGAQGAVLIGLVPSLIALSAGLLPLILAPMVPFIMVGNVILILSFNLFKKKNYWLGVVIAAFLKFSFLWGSSFLVLEMIAKRELAQSAALMMSWPQLATVLAGGALAYFFLKAVKN